MNWARFSIRNRHTIFALSLAVLVFGGLAWYRLPVALFPDTAPPLVNVVTPYPGASAVDVTENVSGPIEEEIATLDGIAKISSSSQDGLSIVTAEFAYDRDVDLVAVDVQNVLSRIRSRLPASVGEPRVLKFSTSDKPVVTLAVRARSGEADPGRVRRLADEQLKPILQRTEGVAAVNVFGGARAQVNVLVDRDRLEQYGLSLGRVVLALEQGNLTAPAGRIDRARREVLLRFDQSVSEPSELERLPVVEREGQRILLGDVARVERGAADQRSAFRVQGEEYVALQVLQRQEANTVEVVERVEALVPELERRFPQLQVRVATEEASFTRLVVNNMGSSIAAALLLASLVIFLFVGSTRGALIVSLSMPMSFLLALAVMKLTGMELNLVTLSAVILAVGMVVDAAVVVLENVERHRAERPEEPMDVLAVTATGEVFFAIVGGVLTTLIVLLPLLFLYGFAGKVFGPLAKTFIYALSSSLLVAVTLIPLLASLLLKRERRWETRLARVATGWFARGMEALREGYLTLLRGALRHRTATLLSVLVLLAASLAALRLRGMEVLPRLDSGSFYVSLETEPGSSFEETLRIVREVEERLRAEPEVTNHTAQVGFEPDAVYIGDAGAMGAQQAFLTVTLTPRTEREATIWEIEDRLRGQLAGIPGIRTAVVREMGGTAKATTSAPLNVRLSGPDLAGLDALADSVSARMAKVPGAVNVYRRWTLNRPELLFTVDRLRAAQYGLTARALAAETYAAVEGMPATRFEDADGSTLPIVVRYAREERAALDDVLDIRPLPGLPLGAVAQATPTLAPNLVTHEALLPTADVSGFHYGRAFSHVASAVEHALEGLPVPPGYEVAITGERSDLDETSGQMGFSMMIALAAVYLLLVAQFRSFVHPFTVMLAVPLVLIGVTVALVLAGKVISLAVLIALILLVGTAVNNSIILLDFILQAREAGVERTHAVIDSVRTRFRPIMMTSLSTVVGMIPLALEWALGAERFSPMAVAIIGGLTASTLLTLVVIPIFYTAVDDLLLRMQGAVASRTRPARP